MTLPIVSSMSIASYDSDDHNQAPAYSLRLRDRHLHQCWRSIFTDIILSPPPPIPPPFTPSFTPSPCWHQYWIYQLTPLITEPRSSICPYHPSQHSSVLFSVIPKRHKVQYVFMTYNTRFPWRKDVTEPKMFMWLAWSKVWNNYDFFFFFLKEVSYAHQGCIYLIKTL